MNLSVLDQQTEVSNKIEARINGDKPRALATRPMTSAAAPWNGIRMNYDEGQPVRRNPETEAKDSSSAEGLRIEISAVGDIATARRRGRALAIELGFQGGDVILIVAVISEVARNIIDYAARGEILISALHHEDKFGILIVARDAGPGIPDVSRAMQYGCTTRKGLGMGLPGVRWLVDEFEINSKAGQGTTVTMKKWINKFEL